MIFFQMPVVILVVLLHLLPIVMLLLTQTLPWEKVRDRIALAQIIGSAVYVLAFPFLYFLVFGSWADIPVFYETIWQIFDVYYAEGAVFFLPVVSASFLAFFAFLISYYWVNKQPPMEEKDAP